MVDKDKQIRIDLLQLTVIEILPKTTIKSMLSMLFEVYSKRVNKS